ITPARDDVAELAPSEFARPGRREEILGFVEETAVRRAPWVDVPVRVYAGAVLPVVLQHDLHAQPMLFGGGDEPVPTRGNLEGERTQWRRRPRVRWAPVEIEAAPVRHPHARPIHAG